MTERDAEQIQEEMNRFLSGESECRVAINSEGAIEIWAEGETAVYDATDISRLIIADILASAAETAKGKTQ